MTFLRYSNDVHRQGSYVYPQYWRTNVRRHFLLVPSYIFDVMELPSLAPPPQIKSDYVEWTDETIYGNINVTLGGAWTVMSKFRNQPLDSCVTSQLLEWSRLWPRLNGLMVRHTPHPHHPHQHILHPFKSYNSANDRSIKKKVNIITNNVNKLKYIVACPRFERITFASVRVTNDIAIDLQTNSPMMTP